MFPVLTKEISSVVRRPPWRKRRGAARRGGALFQDRDKLSFARYSRILYLSRVYFGRNGRLLRNDSWSRVKRGRPCENYVTLTALRCNSLCLLDVRKRTGDRKHRETRTYVHRESLILEVRQLSFRLSTPS